MHLFGNWKMDRSLADCAAFFAEIAPDLGPGVEACVFPSFPFLAAAVAARGELPVAIGAQCCHSERAGAFTGAVAAEMISAVGATHVLAGHSERRTVFSTLR